MADANERRDVIAKASAQVRSGGLVVKRNAPRGKASAKAIHVGAVQRSRSSSGSFGQRIKQS
jgi:hypothetical protein